MARAENLEPLVSVVVPVRDAMPFLRAALQSLIDQSFRDFEVIVVDHRSRDASAAVMAEFVARDRRVRMVTFSGRGLARCLNFAAGLSRAPFLARLDADDLAEPDRLAEQVRRMADDERLGVLGSDAWLIDATGRPIGRRALPQSDAAIRESLARGNPFVHSAVMLRRAAFEAVGGYREGLPISEDYDLWTRMAERCALANLAAPLISYRIHSGGMSFAKPARLLLADTAIRAACVARTRGGIEPFSAAGVPKARAAGALLGLRRADLRREAFHATVTASRTVLQQAGRRPSRPLRRKAWRLFLGLGAKGMAQAAPRLVSLPFAPHSRARRREAAHRWLRSLGAAIGFRP